MKKKEKQLKIKCGICGENHVIFRYHDVEEIKDRKPICKDCREYLEARAREHGKAQKD